MNRTLKIFLRPPAWTGLLLAFFLSGCLLPDKTRPVPPADSLARLEGWVPYWVDERKVTREAVAAGFTDILFFHGTVTASGSVKLENAQGLERSRRAALRGGAQTWLTATNHGRSLEGALGPGRLEAHADSLLAAFAQSRCSHLDLDYESMTPAQARQLPALARLLDARLDDAVRLSFTLQPVDTAHRREQAGMVRELLAMPRVHTVRFMMYDYAWRNSLPGALCPLPAYRRLLDTWAEHADKLTVCLPLYGYDWPRPLDTSLPRADTVLMRNVPDLSAEFAWMREEAELAARYQKNGTLHMAAIPSLRAIQVRTEMALDYGVPAVAFWHLGAARLAPVVQATRRGARVSDPVLYGEEEGWQAWLAPYQRQVCRTVEGDGRSLAELAKAHGIDLPLLLRFNPHVSGSTRGRTIYLPAPSPPES